MGFAGAFVILLLIFPLCKESYGEECGMKGRTDHEMNMNIMSMRNDTGDWVSTITAKKDLRMNYSAVDLNVTFKSFECSGKQTVFIRGVLKEIPRKGEDQLLFHPNCGTNIAIVNGGRSIYKFNYDEYGNDVALTKRPLKDDEVFEVRLDKKISKYEYSMGIGVTTHNPENLELPQHISHLKTGTWMFFHSSVWRNGTQLRDSYTSRIDNLEEGSRLGVKRTEFGTLHLYVDGVDQGPAASRVPTGVYGVYQLHGNAVAATIVDPN